jgi:ribulose-5-phosphate 4-epimerase/fuculose-1-phosphate aldolase
MASHDNEADLKATLVHACHILGMEGQGDNILGHVSARLPGWDRFWMKPARLGFEEVEVDDLILMSLDGERIAGHRTPHEEYPIHAEIMRPRPDVLAVVHTHPLHSVAFAARGRALRPVGHEGSYFWPPDVPVFDRQTDLIRKREQGVWVSDALGEARAVFLLNHGIAVPGPTVEVACLAAMFLERAARMQLLAEADGSTARHTPEEEAVLKMQIFNPERLQHMFDYYVRKTHRWHRVPGY